MVMSQVGRTMKAARAARENFRGAEIVKASELIEIRPAKAAVLSLAARRTLNLMVQTAAGDAWSADMHVIAKSELRGHHKGNERIGDVLDELMTTMLIIPKLSARGKEATLRAPILASTTEEHDERGLVYFQFAPSVRRLLARSSTYAILDARAIRAFESKYSMALYEIGCQMVGRRNPIVRYTIQDLREVLNVPTGSYKDFAQLRRKVLDAARTEIEALADFQMTVEMEKQGRRVVAVRLGFWPKDDHGKEVAAELARLPRVQRRATINATTRKQPERATQRDLLEALEALDEKEDQIPY